MPVDDHSYADFLNSVFGKPKRLKRHCIYDHFNTGDCGVSQYNLEYGEPAHNLTSPNYPMNYPNELTCTWKVTGAEGNFWIVILLIDLILERGYDFVTVKEVDDMGNAHILAVLTGTVKITRIRSLKEVEVDFISDHTEERRGFYLEMFLANHEGEV